MPPTLQYRASARGVLNGQALLVDGHGSIDESGGLTEGAYRLVDLPKGVDPRILVAVKVTGYPNACRTTEGVKNPFQGKSYRYSRALVFESGETLRYDADIVFGAGWLESTFDVVGHVPSFEATGVRLITERWTRSSLGLSGRFHVTWVNGDATVASAWATTRYHLPSPGKGDKHRSINLEVSVDNGIMRLRQESWLSRPA